MRLLAHLRRRRASWVLALLLSVVAPYGFARECTTLINFEHIEGCQRCGPSGGNYEQAFTWTKEVYRCDDGSTLTITTEWVAPCPIC